MVLTYSSPINIVRYSNGTLVKLVATSTEFMAHDYNPTTGKASMYEPREILVFASFQGNIHFGKWQYSKDGTSWSDAVNNQHSITFTNDTLTITPESDLFDSGNSVIHIKCIGDDENHYDVVTLSRTLQPTVIYDRTHTEIQQTNQLIALIASEEQLLQYDTAQTLVSDLTQVKVTAQQFQTTVTQTYSTKSYAESKANTAETNAKNYTANQLKNYSTTTQMQSAIIQKANSITSTVSSTYETKSSATSKLTEAKNYTTEQLKSYSTTEKMQSAIEQKANSITSTVSSTYETKTSAASKLNEAKNYTTNQLKSYSTTKQMNSAIEQKANSITSSVSETYETKGDATSKLSTAKTYSETKVTQLANSFSLSITDGTIGKSASLKISVTDAGGKEHSSTGIINLTGAVRFTDLSTAGSTTINGANITTGIIKDSNSNTTFDLGTGALTMKKGSINIGNGTFSVTTTGILSCTGANITGAFTSRGEHTWTNINNGIISGGATQGVSTGYISFNTYYSPTGQRGTRVCGKGIVAILTPYFAVGNYVGEDDGSTIYVGQTKTFTVLTGLNTPTVNVSPTTYQLHNIPTVDSSGKVTGIYDSISYVAGVNVTVNITGKTTNIAFTKGLMTTS